MTPKTVALALAGLLVPLTGSLALAAGAPPPSSDLVPGIVRYTAVHDLAADAAMTPIPTQATGIGPGSHLIITRPDGTFGCTANFVWEDTAHKLYLGAAGHCFLVPSVAEAVNPPGVTVRVCVSSCNFGGELGFSFTGTLVTLGPYIYARQQAGTVQVGYDFGMVEIPTSQAGLVRTQLPVWGGPTGEGYITGVGPVVLYGNGVGVGEYYPTMARAGTSVSGGLTSWSAEMPSAPGDSGAAVVTAVPSSGNGLAGDKAGGILTHLSVGLGIIVGTQVPQAEALALADAGLTIHVKI